MSTVRILLGVLVAVVVVSCDAASDASDCHRTEAPLLCHGIRVVRSVSSMKPLRIVDGVEIVRISEENATSASRSASPSTGTGIGYVDRVLQYLQAHELKINLNEMVASSGVVDVVGRAMKEVESETEVVGRYCIWE